MSQNSPRPHVDDAIVVDRDGDVEEIAYSPVVPVAPPHREGSQDVRRSPRRSPANLSTAPSWNPTVSPPSTQASPPKQSNSKTVAPTPSVFSSPDYGRRRGDEFEHSSPSQVHPRTPVPPVVTPTKSSTSSPAAVPIVVPSTHHAATPNNSTVPGRTPTTKQREDEQSLSRHVHSPNSAAAFGDNSTTQLEVYTHPAPYVESPKNASPTAQPSFSTSDTQNRESQPPPSSSEQENRSFSCKDIIPYIPIAVFLLCLLIALLTNLVIWVDTSGSTSTNSPTPPTAATTTVTPPPPPTSTLIVNGTTTAPIQANSRKSAAVDDADMLKQIEALDARTSLVQQEDVKLEEELTRKRKDASKGPLERKTS